MAYVVILTIFILAVTMKSIYWILNKEYRDKHPSMLIPIILLPIWLLMIEFGMDGLISKLFMFWTGQL